MNKKLLFSEAKTFFSAMPHKLQKQFWLLSILAVISSLSELILAGAVSLLGVALASPQSIIQSHIVQKIMHDFPVLGQLWSDQRLLLATLILVLCLAVLCKTIFLALLTWKQSVYGQRVRLNFSTRLFNGFLNAPYLWHIRQKISDLGTILSWQYYVGLFIFNGMQILSQLIVVSILLLTICVVTPFTGCIALIFLGMGAILLFKVSRKYVHNLSSRYAEAEKKTASLVHISLNGIREVMIYRQQGAFERKYHASAQEQAYTQGILPIFPPLPSWGLEFLGMLLLFTSVVVLRYQDASMAYITASIALLAAVAWRLLPVVNRIVQSLLIMQQALSYTVPFMKQLAEVEAFPSPYNTDKKHLSFLKEVTLSDVYFKYPGTDENKPEILQGITLRIPKGSMIGLVGTSGAGKSTIAGLLTGLYPPSSGSLLVDGKKLDAEGRACWMESIGYVPQSPFLLNGTIAENIAFSRWGEEIDFLRVVECCKMAAIDFLDTLEDGLMTIIGERGARLSGGQIQRVAIARALYNQPQLIFFDEATSALDGASERIIQDTIANLRGKITVVVIAHRLATVMSCDSVCWIDKGRVKMTSDAHQVLEAYEQHLLNSSKAGEFSRKQGGDDLSSASVSF